MYFLVILLAALCAFVGALAFSNLTPKAALYRLIGRFFDPPSGLRPASHDAPYRQLGGKNPLHKPVLLNLRTSDGSGQACHPDVAYIPEGFGDKSWTYWMVCTPYPYGNCALENPEIFVSWDGLNWAIPDGLQNPLVQCPKNSPDHNSDPDILFHRNELWLYYRETLRSKSPAENRIHLMRSADGIRWSAPLVVLANKTGTQLISPSVLYDGTCFRMWAIELHGSELQLMHRRSADGIRWTAPAEVARIEGLTHDRRPWHIDVIKERDRFSAILVSCTKVGGSGSRIHYAHSQDGLYWVAGGFMLDQAYEFEGNLQYRATLHKNEDRLQEYELWYSAASSKNMFSIAYLKMIRMENQLLPSEMPPLQSETLTALK